MNRGFYWRVTLILVVVLGAWFVLWPSIPRIAPPWVTRTVTSRMNLGLDIRGGLRLAYDVQIGAAIGQRRDRAVEGLREQLATDFQIHQGEGRLTEEQSRRLAERVAVRRNEADNRELSARFLRGGMERVTTELLQRFQLVERGRTADTVTLAVRQDAVDSIEETAVREALSRIERRIDEMGVKETNVTARGESIVIEVPGSDQSYFQQIEDIVGRTARLEFRLCADGPSVLQRWSEPGANLPEGVTIQSESAPGGQGPDGQTRAVTNYYFSARGPTGRDRLREFLRTIRSDIPDTYDLLLGEDDRETRRTRSRQPTNAPAIPAERRLWRTYTVEHVAHVTGDQIQAADVSVRQDTNQPYVSLTFHADGARAFADITTNNVHKRFAIVLDDLVMSAPQINEPITSGSAQITLGSGDYRTQFREAQDLVVVLHNGSLPAPIVRSDRQLIGATLGSDVLRNAIFASAVGIGLVMFFMIFWYRTGGIIANGAVVLNLMLQLAAIAYLGATLTMPGFAGLALTVGMAVDSNVLINERIREELRKGKGLRAAIDAGYQHAFTAIFDGHVTTFISGVVLLQFGTGPIKGFAVTLLIGIVANLFTGVFCTRVVFDWLVRGLRVKRLALGGGT